MTPEEQRGRGLGPTGETVRARIKELRGRIPVTEVSEKLAALGRPIPPLGLRRIESGDRRVDVDDLVAIAIALDVSPTDLLMPTVTDPVEPVTVTGLDEPAVALAVVMWLRGRYGRPGGKGMRIDAWPQWEQDEFFAANAKRLEADARGDDQ